MTTKEAVKRCLYGTVGGYLAGSGGGADLTAGLLGAGVAEVVRAGFHVIGVVLLVWTIWWLIDTVAAIGRASEGRTRN